MYFGVEAGIKLSGSVTSAGNPHLVDQVQRAAEVEHRKTIFHRQSRLHNLREFAIVRPTNSLPPDLASLSTKPGHF